MAGQLDAGDPAPAFSLPDDAGRSVSLADFAGRKLVLFCYPKADTEGCTREAQAFSALRPQFARAGTAILGVSPDPVRKLARFKQKHALALTLLADESHEMLDRYGAWTEKSMYGRKFMGVKRSTFLIGRDGRLARVWRKVRVERHADEVLAAAREL